MPPHRDIARYPFPGYWGREAQCRLRLWQRDRETVVMVTEFPGNPGTSITHAIEGLAMQICRECELWPSHTRWIEHYPPGGPFRESFTEVTLTLDPQVGFTRPHWQPWSRAEVEGLIGAPAPSPDDEVPRHHLTAHERAVRAFPSRGCAERGEGPHGPAV